jgi:MoaA/NifB/PqqE/SkfB family radical SAM enzyme
VLPQTFCFRVTRFCNAACGFCLAPPDGAHPDAATLTHRIDWLLARGVRILHFCGGEPTIHPALPDLIARVHTFGAKSRLTTNGITMPDHLLATLRAHRTDVKVSIHGDRDHHNRMVARDAFDPAAVNLRRLLDAAVPVTVQTTVVAGAEWVVEWMIAFCRDLGVRRLSILPFIPRGSGAARSAEYELSFAARQSLRDLVARRRKALTGRLDIRWLDFTARPVPVVEADGTVLLEGPTEAADQIICRLE